MDHDADNASRTKKIEIEPGQTTKGQREKSQVQNATKKKKNRKRGRRSLWRKKKKEIEKDRKWEERQFTQAREPSKANPDNMGRNKLKIENTGIETLNPDP